MNILGIMTCFNRKEKTLNSIKKLITGNPEINFEFIVIDDNSTDGTFESLKQLDHVTVLSGNGNLYYSGGMRLGISYIKQKKLSSDYILFFNDDVDFYDAVIEKMLTYLDTSNEIIVGVTNNSAGKISYGGVKKKSNFKPVFDIVMSNSKKVYCDTFCGNCVLIPYSIFDSLENIDPVYIHSMGDYDYGLTATEKGYKICATNFFVGLCDNNPISVNWLDKSKSRKERIKLKEMPKGLPGKIWFHFLRKHYGMVSAILFSVTQYLKIIVRC